MVSFVKATPAPEVGRVYDRLVMYGAAAVVVLIAVAQLFTFEDFGGVFANTYGMDEGWAAVFAALVVTLEVAAVPFLLGMRLSPLARTLSMVAGWVISLVWVLLTVLAAFRIGVDANTGLLGATFSVPASGVAIMLAIGLLCLIGYSSWAARRPLKRR